MTGGIPHEAVPVSVVVLIYSSISLALSTSLVCLLISFGERWTYVTLFSAFTALSTLASIIQQLHYAIAWEIIKQAQFEKAVESLLHPGLALGASAQIVDQVLFFIQFYCYNVMSINILFWAIALFLGAWDIHAHWLGDWKDRVAPISKLFSVLFPILIVGLLNVTAIKDSGAGFILVSYTIMFASMSVGGILLIFILYKYIKTCRLVAGYAKRGGWWASGGSQERQAREFGAQGTTESEGTSSTRRSIYDKALVVRFTIGFVILGIFQIAIIVFSLFQAKNNAAIAASGGPNLTVQNTIIDIVLFIPGVTASLVAFLIFGTTKSWRQYRELFVSGCGLKRKFIEKKIQRDEESSRSQGLEFERLPSLPYTRSEAFQGKEVEDRVRMFVRKSRSPGAPGSSTDSSGPSSARTKAGSEPRILQFHKPLTPKTNKETTSRVTEVGLSFENERAEFERLEAEHRQKDATESRIFIMERLPQHRQMDFLEDSSD